VLLHHPQCRLDFDWASTERRTMTIAMRAIDWRRYAGHRRPVPDHATSERDGIDFNLTFIPPTFNTPHREQFDTAYMQSLYNVGFEAAKAGYHWQKFPPGFEAPIRAEAPER
jgi:hypothetical protein